MAPNPNFGPGQGPGQGPKLEHSFTAHIFSSEDSITDLF